MDDYQETSWRTAALAWLEETSKVTVARRHRFDHLYGKALAEVRREGRLTPAARRSLLGARMTDAWGKPLTRDVAEDVVLVRIVLDAHDQALTGRKQPQPTFETRTGSEGPVSVSFVHTWRPRGARMLAASEGQAPVTPLRDDEVEVAGRLRAGPRGCQETFDVLRHGGGWLRPVFAPEGLRPMAFGAFVEAVARGPAWGDNPFLVESRPGEPSLAVDDYADREHVMRRGDDARLEAALAHALDRAGHLHVHRGVVYRTCDEPELILSRRRPDWRHLERELPSASIGMHWRIGDVTSVDDMSTTRLRRVAEVGRPLTMGLEPVADHPVRFPLRRAADAEAVFARFLDLLDTSFASFRGVCDVTPDGDLSPVSGVADPITETAEACLEEARTVIMCDEGWACNGSARRAYPLHEALTGPSDVLVEAVRGAVCGTRPATPRAACAWDDSPNECYAAALAMRGVELIEAELAHQAALVDEDLAGFAP